MKNLFNYLTLTLSVALIYNTQINAKISTKPSNDGEQLKNQELRLVYFPSGTLKAKHNLKSGHYTTFYENGNVEEKGTWSKHNIGRLTRYYLNGNLWQKLNYNLKGKKDGKQSFYYENGNLAMEGNWENGFKSGEIKRYTKNGKMKAIESYTLGNPNPVKITNYTENQENATYASSKKHYVKSHTSMVIK